MREMARMKEPKQPKTYCDHDPEEFQKEYAERDRYEAHLRSLKSYPILPGSTWVKKDELVEGVDFVIVDRPELSEDTAFALPKPSTTMIYTIEDLRAGKVAVINDGTIQELSLVLNRAFPEDESRTIAVAKYYFQHKFIETEWSCEETTNLPTQSVSLFLSGREERMFTLEEMKDIGKAMWKNGYQHGWNDNKDGTDGEINQPSLPEYFKTKFNIEI